MRLLITQFKPTLCANMPGGSCDANAAAPPAPPPAPDSGNGTVPLPLVLFS
jgi:hypothetical protein